MKSLSKVATGAGNVMLLERAEPVASRGEVLLKIGAAGICGTDIHILKGEYPINPPVTLGHELAGTIVALGDEVTGWNVGDRVTSLPFAVVCETCEFCQRGDYGLCASRQSYGSGVNGAFAPYLAVNASGLYRLPDTQDFIGGCLTEPLACCTKAALSIGALQAGETAVVLGPGPIGLLMTQVAHAVGARVILIGLSSDEARLELGRRLGAAHTLHSDAADFNAQLRQICDTETIDVVFECSGAAPALQQAVEIVRKKGRVVQVGLFGKPITVDMNRVVLKDITLHGSFASSRQSWEQALDLIQAGLIDTCALVSDVFPLEDWEQAFSRATNREGLKVVFTPSFE